MGSIPVGGATRKRTTSVRFCVIMQLMLMEGKNREKARKREHFLRRVTAFAKLAPALAPSFETHKTVSVKYNSICPRSSAG